MFVLFEHRQVNARQVNTGQTRLFEMLEGHGIRSDN